VGGVPRLDRILIVRMSALGDIVHALPVLPALGRAYPAAEIDWLADRRYAGVLDLVDGLTRVVIGRPGLLRAVRELRRRRYDAAIDLQGLIKSAAMARASGARRVIGFDVRALRESSAAWLYGETVTVPDGAHIIRKNLSVLPALGVEVPSAVTFPFRIPPSRVADTMADAARQRGGERFALINPGAAWPNKRWPVERFGAVARHLRVRHQLPSFVLWGPGEDALADRIVASSDGAAARAPQTTIGDLLAAASRAAIVVSGDTGPLHLAAAVGAPIVGLYGPTWPERNGPWDPNDEVISRAASCECHHKRRCRRGEARMCIAEISVEEVTDAVDRRLIRGRAA
jgi:lipopolysaccharide heptosyltransferase I